MCSGYWNCGVVYNSDSNVALIQDWENHPILYVVEWALLKLCRDKVKLEKVKWVPTVIESRTEQV